MYERDEPMGNVREMKKAASLVAGKDQQWVGWLASGSAALMVGWLATLSVAY